MLSGIGPAAHLAEHGIPWWPTGRAWARTCRTISRSMCRCARQPVTLYAHWNLWGKARVGAQWLLTGGGGASNQFEAAASSGRARASTTPTSSSTSCRSPCAMTARRRPKGHGFQAHVGPMRSKSRGQVRLRSADPAAAPRSASTTCPIPTTGRSSARIRLTREIFGAGGLRALCGTRSSRGRGADRRRDRRLHPRPCRKRLSSLRHLPDGRADDPMAVVDPECRVIGVEGLRVADSSIFPR
jgi:choline dehydrogenase